MFCISLATCSPLPDAGCLLLGQSFLPFTQCQLLASKWVIHFLYPALATGYQASHLSPLPGAGYQLLGQSSAGCQLLSWILCGYPSMGIHIWISGFRLLAPSSGSSFHLPVTWLEYLIDICHRASRYGVCGG